MEICYSTLTGHSKLKFFLRCTPVLPLSALLIWAYTYSGNESSGSQPSPPDVQKFQLSPNFSQLNCSRLTIQVMARLLVYWMQRDYWASLIKHQVVTIITIRCTPNNWVGTGRILSRTWNSELVPWNMVRNEFEAWTSKRVKSLGSRWLHREHYTWLIRGTDGRTFRTFRILEFWVSKKSLTK